MAAPITALPQQSPFQPPVGLQAQQPFNPLQNIQGPALPPDVMPAPTIDLNAPIVDKFDPAQAQGTKSMGAEMALPLPQQLPGQPVPQPQFGLAEAPAAPAAAPQITPNLGPAKPAQNPAGQQEPPMSKEDEAALNELLAALTAGAPEGGANGQAPAGNPQPGPQGPAAGPQKQQPAAPVPAFGGDSPFDKIPGLGGKKAPGTTPPAVAPSQPETAPAEAPASVKA